jgi:hypothetical protein
MVVVAAIGLERAKRGNPLQKTKRQPCPKGNWREYQGRGCSISLFSEPKFGHFWKQHYDTLSQYGQSENNTYSESVSCTPPLYGP